MILLISGCVYFFLSCPVQVALFFASRPIHSVLPRLRFPVCFSASNRACDFQGSWAPAVCWSRDMWVCLAGLFHFELETVAATVAAVTAILSEYPSSKEPVYSLFFWIYSALNCLETEMNWGLMLLINTWKCGLSWKTLKARPVVIHSDFSRGKTLKQFNLGLVSE